MWDQASLHQAHNRGACTGLLLPGQRKSVESMAARLAQDNVGRMHQSLHHLAEVRRYVVRARMQTVEDMYRLVRAAVVSKGPIRAIYHSRERWLCPHRLGGITTVRFVCCAISTLARAAGVCKPPGRR